MSEAAAAAHQCGAGMTLVTGKSGRYRYYRCTNRHNKGAQQCHSRNVPMEKLDALVIARLADRVLTPERLQVMLTEACRYVKQRRSADQEKLGKQTELRRTAKRYGRSYGTGSLPSPRTICAPW